MTQEEKAKRYDEAIEKAKQLSKELTVDDIVEQIFPELQESEDEKIRKWIIENIQETLDVDGFFEGQKTMAKEAIVWLEKQGDKDKLIKELGEYKVKYTQEVLEKHINSMSNKDDERLRKATIAFLKDFADKGYENAVECIDWLEKQGEQKPNPCENCSTKTNNCQKFPCAIRDGEQKPVFEMKTPEESLGIDSETYNKIVDECVYGEQKLIEWSEEDEKMIQDIINDIAIAQEQVYCKSRCEEEINWIKSLKDRVLPQPKPEWSEEDEYNTAFIIETLLGLDGDKEYLAKCKKMANWLKSLRPQNWTKEDKERYISCLQRLSTGNPEQPETINSKWFKEHVYPQKQWKPSDEQMRALLKLEEMHVLEHEKNQENAHLYMVVKSIREQLHKLREE